MSVFDFQQSRETSPAFALPAAPLLTPRVNIEGRQIGFELRRHAEEVRFGPATRPDAAHSNRRRLEIAFDASAAAPASAGAATIEITMAELLDQRLVERIEQWAFGTERPAEPAATRDLTSKGGLTKPNAINAGRVRLAVREADPGLRGGFDALERLRAHGLGLALWGAPAPILGLDARVRRLFQEYGTPIAAFAERSPERGALLSRLEIARAMGAELVALDVHSGEEARRARELGFHALSGPAALRLIRRGEDLFAAA